jgi:hypothetical protein
VVVYVLYKCDVNHNQAVLNIYESIASATEEQQRLEDIAAPNEYYCTLPIKMITSAISGATKYGQKT